MVGLLTLGSLMADKLSKPETLERIMAADEPCRAAYTKVVDLQDAKGQAAEVAQLSRDGEPVCRGAFKRLDDINIYIPKNDYTQQRDKKAAIDDCAALSRVRADLLAYHGASSSDEPRLQKLTTDLDRTDRTCRASFERLAK
jgi:hypothetical protein